MLTKWYVHGECIIFLEISQATRSSTTHFPHFQKMLWPTLESPKSLLTKPEFPLCYANNDGDKGYGKFYLLYCSSCVKNRLPVYLEKHKDKLMAYSSSLFHAIITYNHLPFSKVFSNFIQLCPNFQIFCPFLPFFWNCMHAPLLSRIGPETSTKSRNERLYDTLWWISNCWYINIWCLRLVWLCPTKRSGYKSRTRQS